MFGAKAEVVEDGVAFFEAEFVGGAGFADGGLDGLEELVAGGG